MPVPRAQRPSNYDNSFEPPPTEYSHHGLKLPIHVLGPTHPVHLFKSEQVISGGGEGDSQLRLDSTSEPLCQTGISSLLMFDLPESEHKSNLKTGHLSSKINHEFNSVP
ncbi:hypothetical protein PSHT_12200 [Puccinia striiformis]|uniref:Uncharacterized protein n=1 Tax=Puccinia striiformis TaxID=27350 RepID=A0A2S4UY94_9BASI|nr:hypothetical protein PSHT_12200 [Puccinia striiformis]